MSDASWDLLSRITQHGELKDALARKIEDEMFSDPLQRKVYRFITKHYRQYRKVPSIQTLAKKFPRARLTNTVDEPPAYYLDRFVRQHMRAHGKEMLIRAAQEIGDDPMSVLEELRQSSTSLLGKNVATQDIDWAMNWKARLRSYKQRASGETLGLETPFKTWNYMTGGLQPEDFIIVSARPGVGKSWFLLLLALWYQRELGKKVLFFTKEMSILALERRADAMAYQLPYNAFRKGQLTDEEYQRYRKGLKEAARKRKKGEFGELIFVSDAWLTIGAIDAKIEQYKPDVVFIDGLYLVTDMNGSSDQWQRVTNVSREARSLAQSHALPLVASSQIHRMPGNLEKNWQNLTLGDLAFADALSQDAESVLALIRTQDMRLRNHLMVKTLKMREEDTKDWGVHWNLNTMQSTFHEIEIEDTEGEREVELGDDVEGDEEIVELDVPRNKKKLKRRKAE